MWGLAGRAWSLAAIAVLGGCGEPLLSGSAYDSPIYTIHGYLNPFPVAGLEAPRIGLVWVDPAQLRDDVPAPAHTSRTTMSADGRFTFSLYAPPPGAAIRSYADPSSAEVATSFAFGELVLYEDRDDDGGFDITPLALGAEIVAPDAYRGATSEHVLVYVEKPLPASVDALPELRPVLSLARGYQLGFIGCTNPDTPGSGPRDPDRTDIKMVVMGTRSATLPVQRTCLRTRPVASPSSPPPR